MWLRRRRSTACDYHIRLELFGFVPCSSYFAGDFTAMILPCVLCLNDRGCFMVELSIPELVVWTLLIGHVQISNMEASGPR